MSTAETDVAAGSLRDVYDRRIAAKVIAEFCHERALTPLETSPGHFSLLSDDQRTEYGFTADLLSLDSWAVDEESLRRTRGGHELPVRAVDLVVDVRAQLGIAVDALPEYLEELIHTVAIGADRTDAKRIRAADLAVADFQTIEKTMTEGHPCFVANAGRLGFSAHDVAAYAPESGGRFRLIWVAARAEDCDVATMGDVDYADLVRDELGDDVVEKFSDVLLFQGLDPGAYTFLPVHPWQWTEKAARLYAADIAERRLVILGASPDEYQPQQSIRTQFNATTPTRHYVKTALSIVNMGFTRECRPTTCAPPRSSTTGSVHGSATTPTCARPASNSSTKWPPSGTATRRSPRSPDPAPSTANSSPHSGDRVRCRASTTTSSSRRWPHCCTSTTRAPR